MTMIQYIVPLMNFDILFFHFIRLSQILGRIADYFVTVNCFHKNILDCLMHCQAVKPDSVLFRGACDALFVRIMI